MKKWPGFPAFRLISSGRSKGSAMSQRRLWGGLVVGACVLLGCCGGCLFNPFNPARRPHEEIRAELLALAPPGTDIGVGGSDGYRRPRRKPATPVSEVRRPNPTRTLKARGGLSLPQLPPLRGRGEVHSTATRPRSEMARAEGELTLKPLGRPVTLLRR